MIQPLISIIIPVYNAEKYIEECLNSVLEQSFQDYEIIIVNDGSTDRSLEICKAIVEEDSRVKVFSTENKGVSHARNYGIRQAEGCWLLFLDSDDYLVDGCLELLENNIDDNVQEICANYIAKGLKQRESMSAYVKPEDVITMILDPVNNHTLPSFYHLEAPTLLGVWGKLFSREIINRNNLCFDEKLKLSEDMLFHIQYLKKIQSVLLLNDSIFYYRENAESVTKKFKKEYVDNRLYLFEQLENYQIKDAVFVASTVLLLNCEIEKKTHGVERKILEKKIKLFWEENRELLLETKSKKISAGRWQNIVYKICAELFLRDLYEFAFLFLRLYVGIK